MKEEREKARAQAAQLAQQKADQRREWEKDNVTARRLFEAYDANEVSADEQYKGRTIHVSGKIKSIDKDFMNNIVIRLFAGGLFETVDAQMLDEQKGVAMGLQKGQQLVLVCRIRGRVMRSPRADRCYVN